jgi:chromosome partitioning protein
LPRHATDDDETVAANDLIDLINDIARDHDVIVIDTPGHKDHLTQVVHLMADTLITPMNDSFLDFDVLGAVDPETLRVIDISYYSTMVDGVQRQRERLGQPPINWIVLRNRLSMLGSRNKRLVGDGLRELSQRLSFRLIDGLSERVIFREYYPRGLTGLDNLNEATLGSRPTMSHVTARQEVQSLCVAMGIFSSSGESNVSRNVA